MHRFKFLINYPSFVLGCVFFSLFPSFYWLFNINSYDAARLCQIFLVFLFSCEVFYKGIDVRVSREGALLFSALWVAMFVSTLFSDFVLFSLREYFLFVFLFGYFFYCLSVFRKDRRSFEFFALVFLLGIVFYQVSFLTSLFAAHVLGKNPGLLVFGGFVNIRHFNQWQILSFPVIFFLLSRSFPGWGRWVLPSILTLNYLMLLASSGRGALLALFVMLIFALVQGRAFLLSILRLNFICFLGGCFLYYFLLVFPWSADLGLARSTTSDRLDLWRESLSIFMGHPLLGIGGAGFGLVTQSDLSHPHNFLLQILVEWGLIPSLVVVFYLFECLRSARLTFLGGAYSSFAFVAFGVTVLYSLVDGVLVNPLGQMSICFSAAWYMSVRSNRDAPSSIASRNLILVVKLFIILTPVVLMAIESDGVYSRLSGRFSQLQPIPHVVSSRFWVEGTPY